MDKTIGIAEARTGFRDLVDRVQYQGAAYIISRNGKPAVAVVPIEVYENWKGQREEFFDAIRKMQKEVSLEPKAADRLAREAVKAARRGTKG